MLKIAASFFLAISIHFDLYGQEHVILFDNISRDDGLAQGTVSGIVEGDQGFIWIATAEGLHRYDGYKFKIYKHDIRDTNSLSSNHLTCLFEDKTGRLWIGTYIGDLNLFNKRTQRFEKIPINDKDGKPNKYVINCISEDEDGSILIGLDGGGMVSYNPEKKTANNYSAENSKLPNNYVKSFNIESNKHGFWVGTAQGLVLYSLGQFKIFKSLDIFGNQYVSDVVQLGNKVFIATNGQGLQIWNTETDELAAIPSPKFRGSRFMNFIEPDGMGALLIGTDGGGLLRFTGDEFIAYQNNPYNQRSIVGDNVETVLRDSRGMLWFGCVNGISRFDPTLKLFNIYQNFETDSGTSNNNVYNIYEDQTGIVWIGTLSGGLVRFNPKTEELKVFPLLKDGEIETKSVRSIFEDSRGILWIGTRDEGLFSFNRTKEKFKHYPPGDQIKLNTIRCIFEDHQGKMWLGTRWGLMLFDRDSLTFKVYASKYLNNNPIYQIEENVERNELLLCTFAKGLHIFHKDKEAFTVLQHAKDSVSPSVNALMCMANIGKDSFLIGTYGGGLNIFERDKISFKTINNLNGLPNNVIYGILEESKGIYWLSTNDGIVRFDMKKMLFRRFDLKYYLQGLEFNEGAYCKTKSGQFFFGGPDGFNYFKPQTLHNNNKNSKLVITSFRKLNEEVQLDADIIYLEEVEVEYNANLISFEFAALNYTKENTYAYMLEGYDEDWIQTGSDRTAYYTRLAPGVYTFLIKQAGPDGTFGEAIKALKVIVNPPYWKTWWFITLLALLILGLIALFVWLRTKAISRSYKHRLVDLELRALRNQMNPHFIFNSLNSIQYFVLKNDPKQAYGYLTKFSNLMRMILQNSRMRYINIEAEIGWLKTYLDLEKLRMEDELEYIVEIDENINQESTYVPSMLIQPYIENSILHGLLPKEDNRKLLVRFIKEKNELICVIEDNGIGRTRSEELNAQRTKKHKSQGLRLTGERLEMLSMPGKTKPKFTITDLYLSSGEASGTRVEIRLPYLTDKDVDVES